MTMRTYGAPEGNPLTDQQFTQSALYNQWWEQRQREEARETILIIAVAAVAIVLVLIALWRRRAAIRRGAILGAAQIYKTKRKFQARRQALIDEIKSAADD